MKLICEQCKKEYDWKEGQSNWTKDGIGNGRNTINSKRFCCYKCGIDNKNQKRKNTCLKLYGVENCFQSEEKKQKIKQTNLERYGYENVNKCKEIRDKIKKTCLIKYGVDHNFKSKEIKEKRKKTFNIKYGGNAPMCSEDIKNKTKQTCLTKYGVKYTFQSDETKNKIKFKINQKYGVDNIAYSMYFKDKFKNKQWVNKNQEKSNNTKRKNNSFNKSKPEDQIYQLLLQKFDKVERQYRSEKYPFNCDFYILSLDLYIEYQGTWTHGKEPYNENKEEHIKIIEKWKSKNTKFYDIAIKVWTISDPKKRKIAKENNLNYLEFFNMEEFYQWYNKE